MIRIKENNLRSSPPVNWLGAMAIEQLDEIFMITKKAGRQEFLLRLESVLLSL